MATLPKADPRPAPRHFSMIRRLSLADFVTLCNGFSGTGSILSLMQYLATGEARWLWLGIALLPLAFVLDAADGTIARKRNKSSPLGGDLDSLADAISFGVAPAALAFVLGMRGALDVVILLYFVGCGIGRLARFNVTAAELADADTGKVKYFEGTPIPTSLAMVLVLAVCVWTGRIGDDLWLGEWHLGPLTLHPLALLYFVSGSAMISKTLRIPKP